MDLREFVRETLVDLVAGIREAQAVEGVGSFVVPSGIPATNLIPPDMGAFGGPGGRFATVVQFDIAVTAETHEAKTGKGGLSVKIVEASVQGQTGAKNTEASRIRFSVPLVLPHSLREINTESRQPMPKNFMRASE